MSTLIESITINLQTDDLTILLLLIAATLFLLTNLYKPQPLVHPILLGRQSDVGRARNSGESAVYRNYGTGLVGRFPVKPAKEVHVVGDLVRAEIDSPRTLWSTRLTNAALQDRVASFATGLVRLAGLEPQKSKVLLLLNDCLEFVISDFALASHAIISLTLTSSALLPLVLLSNDPSTIICHAFFVPQLLEHIYDVDNRNAEHTIIVVGEPTKDVLASVASNVRLLRFEEVEREGLKREKVFSPVPKPTDVYTISYFKDSAREEQGVHLTHENVIAGVAAIRGMFPVSHAISALDTITSAHSLSTAYGRAIAYTALFEGTSFASIPGSEIYFEDEKRNKIPSLVRLTTKKYPIPPTSMLFIEPEQLTVLTNKIIEEAKKSWLFSVGMRHKFMGMGEGFMSNQSLWDRLVFDGARAKVMGEDAGAIRAVVVGGGLLGANTLTWSRMALSIPLINAFTHSMSTAPILASHPLDLQEFPSTPADVAHCGAPSVNVEVKLVGVNDESIEAGGDPKGMLAVRGPPIGEVVSIKEENGVSESKEAELQWATTGVEAKVLANGSFVLTLKDILN